MRQQILVACACLTLFAAQNKKNPAMAPSPNVLTIPLAGPALTPAIAVDAQGRVTVAWAQQTGHNPAIFLQRWNGSKWEALAGSAENRGAGGTKGEAFNPSLALDASGEPAIAWQDRTYGNHEIYYRHWSGTAWEAPGASATEGGLSKTNTGYSALPSLAFDSHGAPVVAWEELYGSIADVWVRRYDTSLLRRAAWNDLGDHPGLAGFANKRSRAAYVSLAADSAGNLGVAWLDNDSGSDQVQFRRWTGKRWEELAGSNSNGGVSRSAKPVSSPVLKLESSGAPVLSWKDGSESEATLQVRRWSGRAWEPVGGSPAEPGCNPVWPALALDPASRPVVAYRTGSEIRVRRWSGQSWNPAGTFTWNNPPAYTLPAKRQMAMASAAGKACVVWVEEGSKPALRAGCVDLK